jgi:glycosyltransferase involved in cell wall biosynthesis
MNVVCLTKRWQHHTASGGYDRLAREVRATVVQRTERTELLYRVVRKLWYMRSRRHLYMLDYRYEDLLAEQRLLAGSRLQRPDVVHVLYGDEQLDLLLRARGLLPCPLVTSFHLPASRVVARFERYQKQLLKGLDAAIVVSRCQLKDFTRWLGPHKVVYVPHGIDIRRFCPGDRTQDRKRIRLIMVGEHMRDWAAWRQIIDECNARKLRVQFDIVVEPTRRPIFAGCANTRLHTKISEDELVRLYRQADVLLIPVTDSTANNSMLESLACGTPVISNSVGGIPDYIDDTCGWLFGKGEVKSIVELIDQLCDNPEVAWSCREAARRKSLEFSWDRVAEQTLAVYEAVVAGGLPVEVAAPRKERFPYEKLAVSE